MGIQVYGFWRSIASFRVRAALRLKRLPFEEISIDILSGEQFKPDYEAINVERVVPTFIHDGHSIFQSLAIIEYLDDIQPEPRLADICIAGHVITGQYVKLGLDAFPAVAALSERLFAIPAFATSHPYEQPDFKASASH